MSLLILYMLFAILTSFMCSLMESTVLSISNSYIQKLINSGKKCGIILRDFKKHIDRPIAAILVLNTIANTLGATVAGAQAGKVFGNSFVGIFAFVFTFMVLVLSEIIPKTIGAVYWRKTAPAAAYIVKGMMIILYPILEASSFITKLLKPVGEINPDIMREEITTLAQIGEGSGAISVWEQRIIQNLLHLDKFKVSQILTPRTVMTILPKSATVGEVLKEYGDFPFSRIPIYGENPDDITGMVLRHDIFDAAAKDRDDLTLESMSRPIQSVPQSLSITEAIEKFIQMHAHIFLVIDEYGGTKGIVTLEDALEALLGSEIVDEKDRVTDMQELARRFNRYRSRTRRVIRGEKDKE